MKSLELHLMIQFLIMYIIIIIIINSHVDENRPQLDDPKMTATEIIDKINEGLYQFTADWTLDPTHPNTGFELE